MTIVTARDFRVNQTKFLGLVKIGESVVLQSRIGNFMIVPITKDDAVVNKHELTEELRGAISELKEMMSGKKELKSLDTLIDEIKD